MSLAEQFSKGSRNRQLAIVSVTALVVVAALNIAYFAWVRTPYQTLFANLRETDAATIVARLDEKGVPYRLRDGGRTILAPADKIDAARLDVVSSDLPLKGVVGFELFNKSDMGLTEFAQRINYQRALQGELARTIMSLDSVETARVHLSLAEPSLFREDRRPPKASITVFPRAGKVLSTETVIGIQRLTAAAVADLDAGSVVVLDDQGRVLSGAAAPAAVFQRHNPPAVEFYYETRARQALAQGFSDRSPEVTVTANTHGAQDAQDWTPETRDFGLSFVVAMAPEPGPAEASEVRQVLIEALGLDPALGDRITVVAGAAAPEARPSAPGAGALALPAPRSGVNATVIAIAVIVVLAGLGLAFALGRHGRSLSARKRTAYVKRLRALLEGDDGDAAATL